MAVSRRTRLVKRVFMAVTEADFADRWTAATLQSPQCTVRHNVDAEEICRLAETMLMQNIDPQHRPAIEAVAAVHEASAALRHPTGRS